MRIHFGHEEIQNGCRFELDFSIRMLCSTVMFYFHEYVVYVVNGWDIATVIQASSKIQLRFFKCPFIFIVSIMCEMKNCLVDYVKSLL